MLCIKAVVVSSSSCCSTPFTKFILRQIEGLELRQEGYRCDVTQHIPLSDEVLELRAEADAIKNFQGVVADVEMLEVSQSPAAI